ncbi:MAG: hypothetical protein ACYC8T_06175 [Myxococcaceae bacterium]
MRATTVILIVVAASVNAACGEPSGPCLVRDGYGWDKILNCPDGTLVLVGKSSTGGALVLTHDWSPTSLTFPAMTTVGSLDVPRAQVSTLSFPVLTTATGDLSVRDTSTLTTLSLPVLSTVSGYLAIGGTGALETLSLPALTTVGGELSFYGNNWLTSISVPALTTVGGDLTVNSNFQLASLSAPMLTAVSGQLDVQNNRFLRQCLVDAIKTQLTTGPSSYTAVGNDGAPDTCP